MKKNFFKKLALVMAMTLAVGSVPATNASAAATPGFKSTAVNVKVGQTKKYNTVNASKYSVKFVIGNKSVATIKYSKGSKAVKVTGVAEGTTKMRAEFKSYKTKKVTTVRVPVTVKPADETPVVVEAALSGVKQTASNVFRVTFTADASKKFTKDSFNVAAVDGSSVLSIKDVAFSADGLSADVTIYHNFDDGVTYNVVCGGVTIPFTASVGEVSRIVIHTASAQENVKTPIEFTLYDANDIDVTSSIDLDSYCVMTIEGSHSGADIDKASKATITMNGIGTTADVTIIYNSNKVGAADVTATQTITCVDAKAVLGNKLFAKTTNVNKNSECAKFYLGLSDSVISVEENETTDDVYFCAKDDKGDVISYDSYKVESSNEDVMNVEINGNTDSGKYSRFNVTGNNIGSAQINITAEKNGKVTKYTIPVTVTKVNEAVSMNVVVTEPVMSNVNDSEYTGSIVSTLLDAKGNEVDATFDYEVVTVTTVGKSLSVVPSSGVGVVSAQEAVAKTYTVKVTGADNKTGKTFVKNVNITVKALPADADPASGAGIKVTYQVKLVKDTTKQIKTTSFDITTDTASVYTRLYATYNGLFAGYVRDQVASGSGITVAGGNVKVNADSQLKEAKVLARFGNLVFDTANTDLLGAGNDINSAYSSTLESIGTTWMNYTYVEDKSGNGIIVYGDVVGTTPDASYSNYKATDKAYREVARSGYYVLEYNLTYLKDFNNADKNGNGSIDVTEKNPVVKKTQSFTLNNKVVVPTVEVESRKIIGDSDEAVKDVLSTNVDMNNNTSSHDSITDVLAADGSDPAATSNGTKLTVKYAVIEDNYTLDWNFYVPVNTTFTVE